MAWTDDLNATTRTLSRRDTDLTLAFPEISAAADMELPDDTVLDGELVIWHEGRLAFELLQSRLNSTPAKAARQAADCPAHYVAFDLLGPPGGGHADTGSCLIRRKREERRWR